ncbi:MAG TPA: PLP-dependent aminotransferase family protein [Rhizobiaceae bacterium]|nr:PLP-dependent aminotransferase family protein [Rhizobiaceae bacterium]
MTNWLPDLSAGTGPLYMRLADTIEHDISGGVLPAGAKLPPQRDLAYDIGVTIGTVGRAYALVRERGLVSGEVGRGTFVLGRDHVEPVTAPAPSRQSEKPAIDVAPSPKLRMDSTSAPDVGQSAVVENLIAGITKAHPFELIDYTRNWPRHWREAGSRWLAHGDWKPEPQNVVPTLGVHAAVMAVISAITVPGDKVVFERLTYSSISRSVNLIGRRSIIVGSDEQGCDPDDFERLCAQQHPKIAFLMPSIQNPTLGVMSLERRKAIAEIARKYNVWLIEDSIYGVMLKEQPPLLVSFAPERTFHVGGLSKAVSAGVRAGWVACPSHLAPRVQTAHKMVTGGMPFLLAELAAQLVNAGHADTIRAKVREEIAVREAAAREILDGYEFASNPAAPFLWLKLPEPWLSTTFKNAAANEGVLVDDEDEYKPGRTEQTFHRTRIGFTSVPTRADALRGFSTLRRLLDNACAGYDSFG